MTDRITREQVADAMKELMAWKNVSQLEANIISAYITQQDERVKVLEDALKRIQWQSIETAPDNTNLILYCPFRDETNPERIEVAAYRRYMTRNDGQPVVGTMSEHSWATHWIPLLDPPAAPFNQCI